ncbi:solute carrier family 25 member 43 isoform X2 [Opisthocomus hoazin]|uniref:solute carrier family 25 member 43 isoform X2 n=1 Tax=Opisthocomus hoazin TaxID=30419 RepID=UPI003F5331EE
MATWRRDGRVTGVQRLGCAGLAGALSLSLTAPLELLTVLAQVGSRHCRRGLHGAGPSLCRAEGLRALWKGNLTACLRLFPYSALQLAASRRLVILFTDELGHVSHWRAIMAGSLAGMVATIMTHPTDVIKTRLIVQNRLEPSYEGILHAFYKIYHQEGLLALYRGFSPAILERRMLWGTMSKALQKSRETTSLALPLSTDEVTLSQKAAGLVRQDLHLVKPCWLCQITSLSSACLSIASRRICSMLFPSTEVLSHFLRAHSLFISIWTKSGENP